MLAKSQKERLGAGPDDAQDVLKHPFFTGLDIKELMEKKIKAEYVPKLTDKYSVENFDPSITIENPTSAVIPPSRMELIKKFEEEFKDIT